MLGTILLIILILMLLGSFPTWPHSRSWAYDPSDGLGTVLIIRVILVLLGRIWSSTESPKNGFAAIFH